MSSRVRAAVAAIAGIAAIIAVTAALLAPADAAHAQTPPRRVLVYGDSLTWESTAVIQRAIAAQLPGWQTIVRSFPGEATCDELPQMRSDGNLNAGVVVLEFVAVPFGSCMRGKDTLAQHTADTQTALALWASRGVPVVLVGAPTSVGTPRDQIPAGVVYENLAAQTGQTYVDAGVLMRDPWTGVNLARLPCLVGETAAQGCDANGLIDVRNHTGHFCAVENTSPCPVYASGGERFAAAIAAAAARAAGRTPAPLPAPPAAPEIQDGVRAAFSGAGDADPVATASLLPPEAIPPDFSAPLDIAPTATTSTALDAPACRAIREELKTTSEGGRAETAYAAPVTGARVDQIVHVLRRTRDAKELFDAYVASNASTCLGSVFGAPVIEEPAVDVPYGAVTYRFATARDVVIQLVRTGRAVTAVAYSNLVTPPPDDVVNAITNAAITRVDAALAAAATR